MMSEAPLNSALRQALLLHALTIPLWVVRVLIDDLRDGHEILLLIAADLLLAFLHRRANQIPERIDWEGFGQHDSWTKAFYFPEALSWYVIARDILKGIVLVWEAP
jgi:hypothetical protein